MLQHTVLRLVLLLTCLYIIHTYWRCNGPTCSIWMLALLYITHHTIYPWSTSWENLFMQHANNKGADQPAHPRSLINAFVVRCLDSIIPLVSIFKISSLYLASVAVQAGSSRTWSQTPQTGFLVTRLPLYLSLNCTSYSLSSPSLVTHIRIADTLGLKLPKKKPHT